MFEGVVFFLINFSQDDLFLAFLDCKLLLLYRGGLSILTSINIGQKCQHNKGLIMGLWKCKSTFEIVNIP